MLETDAAWLAAAIDGEGAIVTQIRQSRFAGERRHFHVSVYNTNRAFVEKAAGLLSGGIFTRSLAKAQEEAERRGIGLRPNKQYYWATTGARGEVERVLRAVRPFLIIKGAKADAALEWLATNPPIDKAAIQRAIRAAVTPALPVMEA